MGRFNNISIFPRNVQGDSTFFLLRAVGRFFGAWLLGRLSWSVALLVVPYLIYNMRTEAEL